MREQIINYARSGHPGLYLLSHEETRVEAEVNAAATALDYRLFAWSVTEGLVDTRDGTSRGAADPLEAIEAIDEFDENTLVLLRDFHAFLDEPNPVLARALKDALHKARGSAKVILITGCRQLLPPELERELVVLDIALPDRDALGPVLDGIAESVGMERVEGEGRTRLLDAASGLTTMEAENAFALSVVETGNLSSTAVAREKASTVRKNGLLDVVEVAESLDDIGGLDALKDWLIKRRDAFGERARDYGLPSPKGLLILGVPGTGKSLTAKATAAVFGRPLLRLDAGRIFGGLVGESEANLRCVIQTAEAIAPCILMIDELEKGFAGSKSSGSTDGGTASRIFGSFITWLQDKTAPVFVVATANDVSQLPPELLRKGRWDELFYCDLPNQEEREAIWSIQISKYGRDSDDYDISGLATAAEGFTGSEVEQSVIDGLYAAFGEEREPGNLDFLKAAGDTVPLSRLMGEEVKRLRSWAKGRARAAS